MQRIADLDQKYREATACVKRLTAAQQQQQQQQQHTRSGAEAASALASKEGGGASGWVASMKEMEYKLHALQTENKTLLLTKAERECVWQCICVCMCVCTCV